jgi:hypothetical protein
MSKLQTDVKLENTRVNKGQILHVREMKAIKADFFKLNPPLPILYYSGGRLKIKKSVHKSKHKFTFCSVLSEVPIKVDIQYYL